MEQINEENEREVNFDIASTATPDILHLNFKSEKDILINQGAEARLYLSEFMGKKCIVKERFEKKYRVPELDRKLTKQRIVLESRNMVRASKNGINTPTVLFADIANRKIYMSYIDNSAQLKEVLKIIYYSDISKYEKLIDKIANNLGQTVAKMHNSNIIHGDLTTSNILLKVIPFPSEKLPTISNRNLSNLETFLNSAVDHIITNQDFDFFYLIDFGLSYVSQVIEDKAVDLYVLKRAIISANPRSEEIFDKMMKVYVNVAHKGDKILEHLKKVELRGRKKVAFG